MAAAKVSWVLSVKSKLELITEGEKIRKFVHEWGCSFISLPPSIPHAPPLSRIVWSRHAHPRDATLVLDALSLGPRVLDKNSRPPQLFPTFVTETAVCAP